MNTEKLFGYAGTFVYAVVVVLILMLNKSCSYVQGSQMSPPGGVDIETEATELDVTNGGGDLDAGNSENGGGSENVENHGTTSESGNTMTNDNSTDGSSASNVHTNTNSSWSNVWNTAHGSDGQGDTKGDGDQGDPNGTPGAHGTQPCKGCPGSGTGLGDGDGVYKPVPNINNGDDGMVVVKVKVDKDGNVVSVIEKGVKGTYGNISEDSYRIVRENAFKWKFKPDPSAGSELRTGYIKYNLRPN